MIKHVIKVSKRLNTISFTGEYQAVEQSTRISTSRTRSKEPILFTNSKRPDIIFNPVVMCALLRVIRPVGGNPTRQLLLRPETLWSSSGGNEWVKASEEKASLGGQ